MTDRIAIYPGSFDPITFGHVNIVRRSIEIFEKVVVAVLVNQDKAGFFGAGERVDLIRRVFDGEPRIQVDRFDGLLVDYVRRSGSRTVIRGLRAPQDFEYEFQMTMMNRRMAPGIDTLFMMTDEQYFYISSRTVKEIASLGGDISGLVPDVVADAIQAKLGRNR